MASSNNAAPVIIKRKKIVAGEGHHGGAWKVAYADFVTAMMAFFLLMWLLGATSEKQRKGVADYFNPTVATTTTGGGSGVLGGETPMPEQTSHSVGSGVAGGRVAGEGPENAGAAALRQVKSEIDRRLTAFGGESMTMQRALRHIVTRLTDEGLVIEMHDLDGAPLFQGDGATPMPVLRDLAAILAEVLAVTRNGIAVNGHVRSYPVTLIDNPVWRLSTDRAAAMRALLQGAGLPDDRLRRVAGHADRKPLTADPMVVRNNRLEVVLLRTDR